MNGIMEMKVSSRMQSMAFIVALLFLKSIKNMANMHVIEIFK